MAKIKIYTTKLCPYCMAAKKLLKTKNVDYEEIDVTFSPSKRSAMTDLAGGRTSVPQIFIDDRHIGGFDDIYSLDQQNGLDPLLAG